MLREDLETRAATQSLVVSGIVNANAETRLPNGAASLVLLSPKEPEFWATLNASAELLDRAPDPIDRWSTRVITDLANEWGGEALFPFGTAPFHPFYTWAMASRAVHVSPVALLVTRDMGLFTSFRGAVALPFALEAKPAPSPCPTCTDQPCGSACPVGALSGSGYDVERCHAYLDTSAGESCLKNGCIARRACPFGSKRLTEQSAYHMRHFHS